MCVRIDLCMHVYVIKYVCMRVCVHVCTHVGLYYVLCCIHALVYECMWMHVYAQGRFNNLPPFEQDFVAPNFYV